MISCKDFWNKRSLIYDADVGPQYQKAYDDTVTEVLRYLKPEDRVLDFACGTGLVCIPVAPHVAQVRAIDIAENMVRQTREKCEKQNISNIEVSQTELFDPCLEEGSFDAIIACNILCYLDNWDEAMARLRSLLKPGGYLLSATDCLGEKLTPIGLKKFWRVHTGKMPFEFFFRMKGLEKKIADAGFIVEESKNLFPAPPNLFVAARRGD